MRASYEHVRPFVQRALGVDGDLIELGVWRGDTFVEIAAAAQAAQRRAVGVDSWRGMDAPTERDVSPDGQCEYPAGGLAADFATFTNRIVKFGDVVQVYRGWIPEVLSKIPEATRFCFAHVDLDQYGPTLCALRWVWPRMSPGGVVAVHDWFFGRDILAPAAVVDWIAVDKIRCHGGFTPTRHIWFFKP